MTFIAVNMATRGRPQLAWETACETIRSATPGGVRFLISLDSDDEESVKYFQGVDQSFLSPPLYPSSKPEEIVHVSIRQREDSTGEKFNRVLDIFPNAALFMPMSDYVAQITPSWDQIFLQSASRFPDGIGVVCNHLANASFPFTQAVAAKLVSKLGWLFPPYYPFWFVDHEIDSIARLIGRYSFADTHVRIRPRPIPAGRHPTMEYREIDFWTMIFDSRFYERRKLAHRIIDGEDFLESGWRKEILRHGFPLVETRDFWINRMLRGSPQPQKDNGPGDDRYWRLWDKMNKLSAQWRLEAQEAGAGVLQVG